MCKEGDAAKQWVKVKQKYQADRLSLVMDISSADSYEFWINLSGQGGALKRIDVIATEKALYPVNMEKYKEDLLGGLSSEVNYIFTAQNDAVPAECSLRYELWNTGTNTKVQLLASGQTFKPAVPGNYAVRAYIKTTNGSGTTIEQEAALLKAAIADKDLQVYYYKFNIPADVAVPFNAQLVFSLTASADKTASPGVYSYILYDGSFRYNSAGKFETTSLVTAQKPYTFDEVKVAETRTKPA